MESPVVKTKKGISPIWILPLVALCLGGYLIYKNFQDAGVMITVRIQDANGLTPGKTEVFFKGIPVGKLVGFKVTPDLKYIDARIEMVKQAKEELTSEAQFWVVRPQVSWNKVTGLDTIVKGSYFEVIPGDIKGKPARFFTALSNAPTISNDAPGLHLILTHSQSTALSAGSPVLYKKAEIGQVVSQKLEDDSSISLRIHIYENYEKFITTKSLFYISSGIHVKAKLPRISVKVDPIKTILQGGIDVETPAGGQPVSDYEKPFHLYSSHQEIEHINDVEIQLKLTVDNVIETGSEIRYQGVKVGSISELTLQDDLESVIATAYVSRKIVQLLRSDTYMWIVKPQLGLAAISNLDTLIQGSYINFYAGTGEMASSFTVHDEQPANIYVSTGLNLVLETDRLGSLGYNKPVYYRQIKVGHTTGYELSETGQNVLIYLNIHEQYINLIRENTKFWNTSGVRIRGGLMTSMKISTESLAAMLDGGITFSTPEGKKMGSRIGEGHHFTLYSDPDEKWLNWNPAIQLGKENVEQEQPVSSSSRKKAEMAKETKEEVLQPEDMYFDYL